MAVTNGALAHGEAAVPRAHVGGEAAGPLIPLESASLPEFFRARRILIWSITAAIHHAARSEHDPVMRRAFFSIALEDSETLNALEEKLVERINL